MAVEYVCDSCKRREGEPMPKLRLLCLDMEVEADLCMPCAQVFRQIVDSLTEDLMIQIEERAIELGCVPEGEGE